MGAGSGSDVAVSLQGKRVLIVDDVITAGTAISESIRLIQAQGGEVVGSVLLLDRKEITSETSDRRLSATQVRWRLSYSW